MENDKLTSGEESLAIIQSMINTAKSQISNNGHLYLMWGWLVLVCSLAEFYLLNIARYPYHYAVWFLTWFAGIYQGIYSYRNRHKRKVRTYTDEILSYVWIVFMILMFMFGFMFGAILGNEFYKFINPGFLALYGMPTFLSGIILKFRPLIIGAICCWVLAITATLTPVKYNLLLLAAGVICAWIIPGYLMRSKFRKQLLTGA